MKQVVRRVVLWSIVYLFLVTLPLGIAALRVDLARRGFLIELGVGLGIVGFMMLGLQFLTTARFRWVAPFFGSDSLIYFHRQIGILTLFVVFAHPLLLFSSDTSNLAYLDPRENLPRAIFLTLAMTALVLLVILPLWGLRLGMSYEWWRLIHGLLAAVVLLVGLAHVLQVGHYVSGLPAWTFWIGSTAIFLGLLIHARVIKPWRLVQKPYRIFDVISDKGDVSVLVIEPLGHDGMVFDAGQYAWMTVGHSPFSLQQHPFSFASSTDQPKRLEFVIKQSGDFTGAIQDIHRGTQVFLEGPYGAFRLDAKAKAAVFIAGGIGVTPALSMLRTAQDRGDERPFILIYGNSMQSEIACLKQVDSLGEQSNVTIIHVLSEPDDEWTGETGFITKDVLERHLTAVVEMDTQYFVCGPPPMMDSVEVALLELGVPHHRLLSERFDFI